MSLLRRFRLSWLATASPAPIPGARPSFQRPAKFPTTSQMHAPRRYSTKDSKGSESTSDAASSSSSSSSSSATSRAQRVIARLPPFLRKYAARLQDAPVSHAAAFLVLHEITAVVPLLGLFGLFHYMGDSKYVPLNYMLDHYGGQVVEGVRRFERYFRRKGWLAGEEGEAGVAETADTSAGASDGETTPGGGGAPSLPAAWKTDRYKLVVEVGLAYAITKVLLPARIALSLWATPWFAGVLMRARRLVSRKK